MSDPKKGTPRAPFRVTFLPEGKTVEVDPADVPFQRDGKPGSLLDIALGADIDIDHACGGVCACSTCHVIVREGFDTLPEATEEEEDQLDEAPGLEPTSRLACQAVPDGTVDLVVEIPSWNRNHAREEHG
ncbi:MAG TPA: 2Fe-2S iron-sulfur cluster binding domain-containing protein [Planctomycetes bacterium]|nr:2Fe-2S iron-sulfur cluster binding domain-containing protein [Planctomycetota bacterium]